MKSDYIVELVNKITDNSDDLELLEIIRHLVKVVIDDIEFMNDLSKEEEEYCLGGTDIIENEDLESLVSITETIDDIINYNNERKG